APEDWSVTVEEGVIHFDGGPLADDEPLGFPITFTAPSDPTTLTFPTVQHCGEESVSWVGDADSDNPAPEVEVLDADDDSETGSTETTTGPVDDSDAGDRRDDDDGDNSPVMIIIIAVIAGISIGGLTGRFAPWKSKDGAEDQEDDGEPEDG